MTTLHNRNNDNSVNNNNDNNGDTKAMISEIHVQHKIFFDIIFPRIKEDLDDEFGIYDHVLDDHILKQTQEMDDIPYDDIDHCIIEKKRESAFSEGATFINKRRGLAIPFSKSLIWKPEPNTTAAQIDKNASDPARVNVPIRGRQIVNISQFAWITGVFCCEISYAYVTTGSQTIATFDILNNLGGLYTNAIRGGEIHRIFWSCFMHTGWTHIIFNLLCQTQYLHMYEPDWGFWRVIMIFWGSATVGNLCSSVLDPCRITVGSSGALFGLMGACVPYALEFWKTLPHPLIIALMNVIVMIISILIGFWKSGTDNWCHIGGGIAGIAIGFMGTFNYNNAPDCISGYRKRRKYEEGRLDTKHDDENKKTCCGPIRRVFEKERDRTKKIEVTKSWFIKQLQKMNMFSDCKCGKLEWTLRITGFLIFVTMLFLGFWFLLVAPAYTPLGTLTFSGLEKCCCCIPPYYKKFLTTQNATFPDIQMVDNSEQKLVICGRCVNEDNNMVLATSGAPTYDDFTGRDPQDPNTWTKNQQSLPCAWTAAPRDSELSWDPFDPTTWKIDSITWDRTEDDMMYLIPEKSENYNQTTTEEELLNKNEIEKLKNASNDLEQEMAALLF